MNSGSKRIIGSLSLVCLGLMTVVLFQNCGGVGLEGQDLSSITDGADPNMESFGTAYIDVQTGERVEISKEFYNDSEESGETVSSLGFSSPISGTKPGNTRSTSNTALIGGPGGNLASAVCPVGEKLTGLKVQFRGGSIEGARILCGPLAGMAKTARGSIGKVNGGCCGVTFREGYAITSSSDYISSLRVATTYSGSWKVLHTISANGWRFGSAQSYDASVSCPSNLPVAVGIRGKSGGKMDSIGLICSSRTIAGGPTFYTATYSSQNNLKRTIEEEYSASNQRARVVITDISKTPRQSFEIKNATPAVLNTFMNSLGTTKKYECPHNPVINRTSDGVADRRIEIDFAKGCKQVQ